MFSHKYLNPVTLLTHDVTSASKYRKLHFGRIQSTLKSCLNVSCLPVDPLSFNYRISSCDATYNTTLTRVMSLCKLKYGVVHRNST